jgi:hypothetical protein
MAAAQTAMIAHLPYAALRDAIFADPTMSEGLNQQLAAFYRRALERHEEHTNELHYQVLE